MKGKDGCWDVLQMLNYSKGILEGIVNVCVYVCVCVCVCVYTTVGVAAHCQLLLRVVH